MEARLEIVDNLRRLFEHFLDEKSSITANNVYFEKLITLLTARDNAYLLQVPFVMEWVDRCINIFCEDVDKLNTKVTTFALNLLSLLARNEWIVIEIRQRGLVERVLEIVKSKSRHFNPSIKLSIIRLFSFVCECSMGLAYLGKMKVWQFLIECCNQDHTIYVVHEARRLLYNIIYKFDVKTKDAALVREILNEILKPLIENVFVVDNESILVNVEDDELLHKLSSTVELMSYIFQQTLESKEKTNIAHICQEEQQVEINSWKLVDMAHNESFICKVLTALVSFNFAHYLHDKWDGKDEHKIEAQNSNEFVLKMFNHLKFCITRNYHETFLKITELNHRLWKRLGERAPKQVYIENELVRLESQLITFQMIPLHMILWPIEEEEIFAKYLTKILDLTCEQTLRISYAYRDSILNMPPTTTNYLPLKSVNCAMSMIDCLHRDEAVIVTQACIYAFRELTTKLYKTEHKQCHNEMCDFNNLPTFTVLAEYTNIIHAILVALHTLIDRFKITWRDSIETLCLVNCVLQLLLADDLPVKVSVQSFKLLQLCLEHFLSPTMALLVDDLNGSGLMIMAPIIKKRSHDPNWEVRDSVLELALSIAIISHIKYPIFQQFLAENWICRIVYDMATNDTEPYVRASALKCMTEMVSINGIFDGGLCKENIPEFLFAVIYNEPEGIVRKEAVRTLAKLTRLRKIPDCYKDIFYSTITYSIINDLHWEVKVEAIKCLKTDCCEMLGDEGMLDGSFPSVTFSKEKRKIVQLTKKEISLRYQKLFTVLSERGCLGVILKCLREDCDATVIAEAKFFIEKMQEILRQHDYLTSLDIELPEATTSTTSVHQNSAAAAANSTSASSSKTNSKDDKPSTSDKRFGADYIKQNPSENIATVDKEIYDLQDSDEVIESILNSQDINYLGELYKENLKVNEESEEREKREKQSQSSSLSGSASKAENKNKHWRKIDPFYYKKFSNVSPNEYVANFVRADFEEEISQQEKGFLCEENLASLLDEMLFMLRPAKDSETISADCY